MKALYQKKKKGMTTKDVLRSLVSDQGSQYKADSLIKHAVSQIHLELLGININTSISKLLRHSPDTDTNALTDNSVLKMTSQSAKTYRQNVKDVGTVYNDTKCVTVSTRTYPARRMVGPYVEHCIGLKDGPFKPFEPKPSDLSYNNRARHAEIRSLISMDVTDSMLKPIFQPMDQGGALAFGTTYDGWRAFGELFIHACSAIQRNGGSLYLFVGLILPTDGGAHGCAGSFVEAYRAMFKHGIILFLR